MYVYGYVYVYGYGLGLGLDLAQRRVGVGAAERLSWVGRRVAGEQGVALAHGHRGDLDAWVDGWMGIEDGWVGES